MFFPNSNGIQHYFGLAMSSSIGRFRDGVPDGWCWIFAPDDSESSRGSLYIKFKDGQPVKYPAVLVSNISTASAWLGTYNSG